MLKKERVHFLSMLLLLHAGNELFLNQAVLLKMSYISDQVRILCLHSGLDFLHLVPLAQVSLVVSEHQQAAAYTQSCCFMAYPRF